MLAHVESVALLYIIENAITLNAMQASQILAGIYTAADCTDAADARYAMNTLMERNGNKQMEPAVLRRYIALKKLVIKFEGQGK